MSGPLLNYEAAAAYLTISERLLSHYVSAGAIEVVRMGRSVSFSTQALDAFIAERTVLATRSASLPLPRVAEVSLTGKPTRRRSQL